MVYRCDVPECGGQKQDFEQYHQIGVEAFGYDNIDIELEHILMQYDFSVHYTLRRTLN